MSSPSSNLPLIVVAGSTGNQGGSVVRFLLEDGGFRVRAITRNVESAKAKELAAKGVEVVKADFEDPGSIFEAFKGAYGVFGCTNFWDPAVMSPEKEFKQGKILVDAAKQADIKHFVWSTVFHTGDVAVPHWDSKAKIDDYLKASGVPRTSLYLPGFYENFLLTSFLPIKKNKDGALEANWPLAATDGPIAWFVVAETGAYALQAFKNPTEWIGNDIKVITEINTPRKIVKILEEITGKSINMVEISREAFDSLQDEPWAVELWKNNTFFYLHNGNPGYNFELTKRLYPQAQNFESWARSNIRNLIPE